MANDSFKIKKSINLEPQAAAPASPQLGDIYTDSVGKHHCWNGTVWNLVGATAASELANTPSGNVTSTTVQTAVNELQNHIDTLQTQVSGKQAAGNYLTGLTGDVTAAGPGSVAATVSAVGGSSAVNVHAAEQLANAATSANTSGAIVKRDGSGNVTVGEVYGSALDSPSAGGTVSLGAINATTVNIGSPGATVNIQGATTYIQATNTDVTDQLMTLNHGGTAGSGAGAGIEVEEAGSITGYEKVSSDRNSWTFKAPNTAGVASLTPGASNDTVALLSATQTLANKAIDAASNTLSNIANSSISASAAIAYSKLALSGSIVDADISATAAIAPSKIGQAGATTSQALVWNGTSWAPGTAGGSGVGAKNYIANYNFEANTTSGWSLAHSALSGTTPTSATTAGTALDSTHGATAAAGTLAFSATATGKLSGSYSGSLASSAATTAGDMLLSSAYSLDLEDQAKMLAFKFYYKLSSGTGNFSGTSSNTWAVWIYDVTNGAWIQPAGVYNLVQSAGVGIATGTFQTPSNMTQFQLALVNINATGGAITLLVDDFSVGPQTTSMGPAMTDMVDETGFTFSGFGTIGTASVKIKRVGDILKVKGYVTTGTAAASVASINFPSKWAIDSSKLGTRVNSQRVGFATVVTSVGSPATPTHQALFYDGSTTNALYFGQAGESQQFDKRNGNSVCSDAANDFISFEFEIPITGWSSNTAQSSDTDTRVITANYSGQPTGTLSSSYNTITFPTQNSDTAASYSGGSYTIPVSGYYDISAQIDVSGTFAANQWAGIALFIDGVQKNTNFVYAGSSSNTELQPQVNAKGIKLNAGQVITIRAITNGTSTSFTSSANTNYFSISRQSGPAVVQATESVVAIFNTGGTDTMTNATSTRVNFATKEKDSHGAVTVGTTTWQFVAPVSGTYLANAVATVACNVAGTTILRFVKGGTEIARGPETNHAAGQNIAGIASAHIPMNAGDTLWAELNQSSGANRLLLGYAQATRISIVRVGN